MPACQPRLNMVLLLCRARKVGGLGEAERCGSRKQLSAHALKQHSKSDLHLACLAAWALLRLAVSMLHDRFDGYSAS
jgi:hypothetical protein